MKFLVVASIFLALMTREVASKETDLHAPLGQIQQDYQVPGMALIVASGGVSKPLNFPVGYYAGVLSVDAPEKVTSGTYFPVASLTKVFASHLALSLVKQGKLRLDDPISKWLPEADMLARVTIANLLSHTMIGKSGRQFFYDPRFYLLTQIIEKSSGKSFEPALFALLESDFQQHLPKAHWPLPYKQGSVAQVATAVGHSYGSSIEAIPHDFGLSASAGLMFTAPALARMGVQLMQSHARGIDNEPHILASYQQGQTYANGFFRQQIHNQSVLWSYGQYEGYAALWLMVPELELQLLALANNNIPSDASRLLFGDASTSPIVNWFTRYFLCDKPDCAIGLQEQRGTLHRHVYFSRYHKTDYDAAIKLMARLYPDQQAWSKQGDTHLLHLATYLTTVSIHLGYPPPPFKAQQRALLATKQIQEVQDPYWLFYAGLFYLRDGNDEASRMAFETLVNIPNMPNHWTVQEAKSLLQEIANAH